MTDSSLEIFRYFLGQLKPVSIMVITILATELVISLAALLGALTIGVMSPGSSFVLVARIGIAKVAVDRTAGGVLGLLGPKRVASGHATS